MALFGLLCYFLPSSLAAFRRRKRFGWILGINLLLGWTVIGWIVALIWAFAGKPAVDQKPRSKAMSFALGGLVVLGVISFPVILINAPKVPAKPENTMTATSSPTASQAAVPVSVASSSTPAQVASTPSTPENERKIGEEFTLGDYTYRITGFSVASKVGSGSSQLTAEEGAKFVLVNFTIRNDSNKTQQVLADDFKIKDQRDREFSNDSNASSALVWSGGKQEVFLRQIQPGLSSKGVTVFRVPADVAKQSMLLVVPEKKLFSRKSITIVLNQ